jgi:hypothetical protein
MPPTLSLIKFQGKATVQSELLNIKSMWEKEDLNDDVCLAIQKISQGLNYFIKIFSPLLKY